jgi:hypothetical protein
LGAKNIHLAGSDCGHAPGRLAGVPAVAPDDKPAESTNAGDVSRMERSGNGVVQQDTFASPKTVVEPSPFPLFSVTADILSKPVLRYTHPAKNPGSSPA